MFRFAAVIENFKKVTILIIDKTGTLAKGRPELEHAEDFDAFSADEVLRLAISLDQRSEHPLAHAKSV
ncbi:hypothetical protein GPM19_02190 [Halomonas sp. ZH2S]|uniref:Uncharacterized protein n=1 Tax=Vreelandella zhuhanensis TaxID=2684210 RepID=A0A7X3GYR4_9GAMM|nr:hypothetical protein [Halomonas zhuhanensis]MWJ27024.1 hypothetical protein [Halomonas zhuhanensis]